MLSRRDLDYRRACNRDRVSIASRIATQIGGLKIDGSMLADIDLANMAVTSLDHVTNIVNAT